MVKTARYIMIQIIRVLIMIVFVFVTNTGPLSAMSSEQKKLLRSGIFYFNAAEDNANAGSNEGCISGKLPTITNASEFASAMTSFVKEKYPRSPFLENPNFGDTMVSTGQSSGVNPMLVIAIGAQESGMGQDSRSAGINQGTHNSFGMTAGRNDPGITIGSFTWIIFPSFEASLTAGNGVFERLKNGYVYDPNVATFDRIINRWLTGNVNGTADIAGNQSSDYVKNATKIINEISSQPGSGVDCTAGGSEIGQKIVAIAQAELSLGVKEDPDDSNCLPIVNNKYMGGVCQSWCANFVSWVYLTAGRPFTGGLNGGWRLPGVTGMTAWFKANANWYDNKPGSSAPQPGDAVMFSYSGGNADSSGTLDHVGIIETVNGNTITTIEGNASNSVKRNTYNNYTTSNQIVGWGRLK